MTDQEQEEGTSMVEIQAFLQRVYDILERWMKIMNLEEKDVMSALIVDQLFKSILIKLDSVFGLQDKIVNRTNNHCEEKINVMKSACQ
jgi:hypothetical protein